MTVTIQEFSDRLNTIWDARLRANEAENIAIPALGFAGEVAEVNELLPAEVGRQMSVYAGRTTEHFKKYIRDGKPIVGNMELAKEMGDALHYWCRLAYLAGFTPADIMRINEEKLAARRAAKAAGTHTANNA